jgi:hypothetical protein
VTDNLVRANFGGAPFVELGEAYEAVWDALMQFDGRIPTLGAVGVLRLIEHRLLTEVHDGQA